MRIFEIVKNLRGAGFVSPNGEKLEEQPEFKELVALADQQENTLIVLPIDMPITKGSINRAKLWWIDKVNSGEIGVEKVFPALIALDKIVTGDSGKSNGLKDDIKGLMVDYLQKNGEGNKSELMINNFKAELRETGVKYNYTGDPIWERLNFSFKEAEELRKAREERLKTVQPLKPGQNYATEVDEDTGEAFEVKPPAKTSTTSPVLTLIV